MINNINGLFIIGNKRSGSTQMMRLLNLHPKIFISNETDILWILYHYHNNIKLKNYIHDSPTGMNKSIELAGHLLSENNSVLENFILFQKQVMNKGFLSGDAFNKENLTYIGDQKPYQNADPLLIPFILENFPKAKFIHLIRHPYLVTTSSKLFLNGKNDIWGNLSDAELMEKWCFHEKNVIEAIDKHNIDFIRINYSDLILDTKPQMGAIYDFLNLEYNPEILKKTREITKYNYKPINNYPRTIEQKEIMLEYGFKENFGLFEAKIVPYLFKYYNKVISKLKK
ncbi:sulfotransferase [Psychroflexus sp. CAK57W]|uniref:sulfotransferase family protein n=1 Tax=Psychroflexus curvus TaxID=2873595 RepID=UPI001CCE18F1|nr:sulfotransferase [Psychroflexus curvus]MBZ9787838.1 sulfotransferase [Psychroflexus curvus]